MPEIVYLHDGWVGGGGGGGGGVVVVVVAIIYSRRPPISSNIYIRKEKKRKKKEQSETKSKYTLPTASSVTRTFISLTASITCASIKPNSSSYPSSNVST